VPSLREPGSQVRAGAVNLPKILPELPTESPGEGLVGLAGFAFRYPGGGIKRYLMEWTHCVKQGGTAGVQLPSLRGRGFFRLWRSGWVRYRSVARDRRIWKHC